MDTLTNGAQVLLPGQNSHQEGVVLAITETDFATWAIDENGDCYWGHYFGRTLGGLIDAVRDFRHRTHCDQDGTKLPEGEQP